MRRTGAKKRRLLIRKYEEQGGLCFYCGQLVNIDLKIESGECVPAGYPTVDHIVPLDQGGTWAVSNLVLACRRCNQIKSNGIVPEFILGDRVLMADLFLSGRIKGFLVLPVAA